MDDVRLDHTMIIEEWLPSEPRWNALMERVAVAEQTNWMTFEAPFHRSSHTLVAFEDEQIGGFLRFVVQEIGPDMDCPPLIFKGAVLTEAKVIAFAVMPQHRGRGIGRALQQQALILARSLGCYQMRSHSAGAYQANHELKLSMGFGVHPIVRGEDKRGVYFVLPLWAIKGENNGG